MSDMVERVARAMIAVDSGPEGSAIFAMHLDEFGDGYRKTARAAIEAMREPNVTMIHAGVTAETGKTLGERSANCFTAMIDAALEAKP